MEIPSLGRRLAALMIDWVIAMLSAVALAGVEFPPASLSKDPSQTFIVLGFFIAEVALLDGLLGSSIGKRLMGLRLENPEGRPIGIPRAVIRMVLLCLFLPAVVMTDDKRGLHDLAAGSRVVRDPARA
ncbi:RDD family protein [Aeromicrobium sp. UC242_57]|uniref:RDD family protein n=1 Tax=Aeromicrobium sp. UC242_57 TaxID=3374624 RepID=UPI0037885885